MDQVNKAPKKGSIIWRKLTGVTGSLYRAVGTCALGRAMTGYRKADALLHHERRRTHRDDCRPMSRARLRVVEAVRGSRLFRGLAGLFTIFAYAPASFYGLFLLFFGLLNIPVYYFGPRLVSGLVFDTSYLFLCGALSVLGLPLLFSRQALVRLLTTGRLTRWCFVALLGLDEEPVSPWEDSRAMTAFRLLSPYLAFLMALGCAIAALWLPTLLIPGILLLVALAGMIFAHPEAGVVLAVTSLPLMLCSSDAVLITAVLILLTWSSFGIKLLFMHRTIRFNLIDVAVLIFALSVGLGGMTGGYVTPTSVLTGILCLILFSLFFLVTNLMIDMERLRRCLVGPVIALLLVLVTMAVTLLPTGLWDFLAGSRGGDALKAAWEALQSTLTGWWHGYTLCLPMMAIPFLTALLFQRNKRFGYYLTNLFLLALSFAALYLAGSSGTLLAAAGCVILFLLLYSHRTLAFGILAIPVGVCGGIWIHSLCSDQLTGLAIRLATAQQYRENVWRGAWRMVCNNPAGIGLGSRAFVSVYPPYAEVGFAAVSGVSSLYMDLMVTVGLPGLFLFLVMAFLFFQKTFTCLRASEAREDTLLLLGGLTSLLTLLVYGLISDAPVYLPIMAVAVAVMGILNAFENMVFDRWDIAAARVVSDDRRAECVLHIK